MGLTKVTYSMIEDAPANVIDFGAVGDGVTDDTVAFTEAITAVSALNGGTVYIPQGVYKISSTLNINNSNVRLLGVGGDFTHDGGSGVDAATKLVWAGSTDGTFISIVSPSGSTKSKITGCGIFNLELDGAGVAGKGIYIKSHNNGIFENIMLSEFRLKSLEMTCYVSGTELAEAADNQGNMLSNITARNLSTGSGVGFWFDGSSNANTSYNKFESLTGIYNEQPAFVFANADTNVCIQFRAFRSISTTTWGYEFYGKTASGSVGGDGNYMFYCQAPSTYGIVLKGTTSGFTDGTESNYFLIDSGNGTQIPTAETGSIAVGKTLKGTDFGGTSAKFAMAEDVSKAITERNLMTSETLRVYNNSNAHLTFAANNNNSWNINVDGTLGDLRFVRLSGTGSFDLPSHLTYNGSPVTYGTADSGGTGYRVLRIPN